MSTSILDEWSSYIVEIMSAESSLAGGLLQHPVEKGSARESLVQGVLRRLLPSDYEIGSGEIVDHTGGRSKQMDVVIFRPDFPSLSLPSGSRVFLVESVLATIEVKSTLTKSTLYESLDNCASVAELKPNVVKGPREKLAKKWGMKETKSGDWTHDDPLINAQFTLFGRPPTFVFGFDGYGENSNALAEAIGGWIDSRNEESLPVGLKHLPAVVASKGCYCWRNADPYKIPLQVLCGVGQEQTPLRLLILQLLYSLIRRLPIAADVNGIVPNLDVYLSQMSPPKFDCYVGTPENIGED